MKCAPTALWVVLVAHAAAISSLTPGCAGRATSAGGAGSEPTDAGFGSHDLAAECTPDPPGTVVSGTGPFLAGHPFCPWNGCLDGPVALCGADGRWHCPAPPHCSKTGGSPGTSPPTEEAGVGGTCPGTPPADGIQHEDGGPCPQEGLICTYGFEPVACGGRTAACTHGTWAVYHTDPGVACFDSGAGDGG